MVIVSSIPFAVYVLFSASIAVPWAHTWVQAREEAERRKAAGVAGRAAALSMALSEGSPTLQLHSVKLQDGPEILVTRVEKAWLETLDIDGWRDPETVEILTNILNQQEQREAA